MQFHFSFKQMDSSEALQRHAESKVQDKVRKFVTKPIEAHITFAVEKHRHKVLCRLRAGDGFSIDAEHVGDDMYSAIDQMVDKLGVQLKKHKEKLKNHKGRSQDKEQVNLELRQAEEELVENDVALDAGDVIAFEKAKNKK